jgi:hypothetical protein
MTTPDFRVITYGHGSLVLLRPENAAARDHLEDNVQAGAVWISHCLVVEVRYLQGLIEDLIEAGFTWRSA